MNAYYVKEVDGKIIHGFRCTICGKDNDNIDNSRKIQHCKRCMATNKFNNNNK